MSLLTAEKSKQFKDVLERLEIERFDPKDLNKTVKDGYSILELSVVHDLDQHACELSKGELSTALIEMN